MLFLRKLSRTEIHPERALKLIRAIRRLAESDARETIPIPALTAALKAAPPPGWQPDDITDEILQSYVGMANYQLSER